MDRKQWGLETKEVGRRLNVNSAEETICKGTRERHEERSQSKNNTPKKAERLGEVDMAAAIHIFHMMSWHLPINLWNFPHCPRPKLQRKEKKKTRKPSMTNDGRTEGKEQPCVQIPDGASL